MEHFVKEVWEWFKEEWLMFKEVWLVCKSMRLQNCKFTSPQILLSRCLVDLLSFEISLCVFATFARGKPNFVRKSFGGMKKFLYFCTYILSDIKKRFCLFLVIWNLQNFNRYTKEIRKERSRVYRGLFLFGVTGIAEPQITIRQGSRLF